MTKYDLTDPPPPPIFQYAPSPLDRPADPQTQARQGLEACERLLRETLGVSLKEAIAYQKSSGGPRTLPNVEKSLARAIQKKRDDEAHMARLTAFMQTRMERSNAE